MSTELHMSPMSEKTPPKIIQDLLKDFSQGLVSIKSSANAEMLSPLREEWLGKKGRLSQALQALAGFSLEEKKYWGPCLTKKREEMQMAFAQQEEALENIAWNQRLQKESLDVTLPCAQIEMGVFHPLAQGMEDIISIFRSMGFSLRWGPDVETSFYNFDALNIPPEHPARTDHDTFHLPRNLLLRTHTSCVQVRTLAKEKLPLRIISPGRVYRADYDRTHSPMFHQVEVLVAEEGITMGHLKGCIEYFLTQFFCTPVEFRMRPSFFPFTEPSAEVDIRFSTGPLANQWLEVLGCGMVHPEVFRKSQTVTETTKECKVQECAAIQNSAHNTFSPQGFAMGMGVERLVMLKYGINDLRLLFLNDQRWLSHYGQFSSV